VLPSCGMGVHYTMCLFRILTTRFGWTVVFVVSLRVKPFGLLDCRVIIGSVLPAM